MNPLDNRAAAGLRIGINQTTVIAADRSKS